jgi:cyclopropane fatty-acyl-phospholipid synthase-like methyltransferase
MWDENTRNFAEALENTNRKLLEISEAGYGARVLDAGCGVGGSSFFLAKEIEATVTGLTLSEKQLDFARMKNHQLGLQSQVDFKLQDYTKTEFNSETFDLIWAIESLTSAPDKSKFAKEAYRILKPGGRLIIADYFRSVPERPDPKAWMIKWQNCWSLSEILREAPYKSIFEQHKFKVLKSLDVTPAITPSAVHMYRAYVLGMIPSVIYNAFHTTSRFAKTHYLSAKYQYKALRAGLWEYRILLLEKQ